MLETANKTTFRDYTQPARDSVEAFYRANHIKQTTDFVRRKQAQYSRLDNAKMSVWEAIKLLDSIVDDSDPDTELSQLDHALQTAEAMRRDGQPRWFILTGLIHDLGKVLTTFGEPQWAVVGDTFPVGCPYSQKIVYHHFFEDNPDNRHPDYNQGLGIYQANCGLDKVMMSWGHDEYLYYVIRDYLPLPAQYIIRYHSFYAWHRGGAYQSLTNEQDQAMLAWVKRFNPYDLYSKADEAPDFAALKSYYEELVAEFLPNELAW